MENVTNLIERVYTCVHRLSEDQIYLCECRNTLLQYLQRLNTYEVGIRRKIYIESSAILQAILGGPAATFELYDPSFYKEFRCQNLVRAAVGFAQVRELVMCWSCDLTN